VSDIHDAVKNSNYDAVKRICESDPNRVNEADQYDWTPLHHAAGQGAVSIVEFLIANGARVNALNNDGSTPLTVASGEVIKLLLLAGADSTLKDERGSTVLHRWASYDACDWLQLALERGADPCVRDADGRTPLHIAADSRHRAEKVVALLLKKGTDPNMKDDMGCTPLYYAMMGDARMRYDMKCQNIMALLRKHGGHE
jgi:ankyrin repeat protein